MNVVLMGLRGAGKTTLASLLAAHLARPSLDLDDATLAQLALEGKAAPTVTDAWRAFGEAAFRAAESRALADALGRDNLIIALGGGTPTAPGAAEMLLAARSNGSCRVVYLRAGSHVLRSRLKPTDVASRPSLTGAGTLEEIDQILAARDPLYRTLADVILEIEGRTERELVEACAMLLQKN